MNDREKEVSRLLDELEQCGNRIVALIESWYRQLEVRKLEEARAQFYKTLRDK